MLEAFDIVLDDNTENVYHQGENLNGHVKVLLDGHKKITELSITFRGEASTYTSWLHRRGTNLSTDQCGASETYFEEHVTVINDETSLKTGVHIFPFKFTIPSHQNLPSTFEGDHGHVKYFVSARLNSYLYTKKIFTLIGGQAELLDMDSLLTAMVSTVSMFFLLKYFFKILLPCYIKCMIFYRIWYTNNLICFQALVGK